MQVRVRRPHASQRGGNDDGGCAPVPGDRRGPGEAARSAALRGRAEDARDVVLGLWMPTPDTGAQAGGPRAGLGGEQV